MSPARLWQRHWSILAGVAIGVLLIPVISAEWQAWRHERQILAEQGTPVVQASAVIVERKPDAVLLRVTGVKVRDCKLVGTQAFSVHQSVMSIARMERVGGPVPINLTPRPVGPFDMGVIRVWPVTNEADEVVLYALHTCGPLNIEVRSTLARVALNGG